MKLNLNWVFDPSTGKGRPVITDERGERLPCVRGVDVSYSLGRPTEIVIHMIADGNGLTIGSPDKPSGGTTLSVVGPGGGSGGGSSGPAPSALFNDEAVREITEKTNALQHDGVPK